MFLDEQRPSPFGDLTLVFPAFSYACTLTIVSSIPAAPFSSEGPATFCHPSRPCSHESTESVHMHVG